MCIEIMRKGFKMAIEYLELCHFFADLDWTCRQTAEYSFIIKISWNVIDLEIYKQEHRERWEDIRTGLAPSHKYED